MVLSSALNLSGEALDDEFGYAVSGVGDLNGDGYADVVVGARGSDADQYEAGRAYVFWGGATPNATPDVILSGGVSMGALGTSVSGAGDVNGDNAPDVIVGAREIASTSPPLPGSAYVYFGGATMDGIPDASFHGEAPADGFGVAVAPLGDVRGDGFADVIVGAGNNDAGGMSAGRAYLIDFNRYVLTSPNGGESWMANHVQTVSWRGAEPADLFISLDNGATESLLASGVGGLASNSVGVTAPNLITDLARIRVAPTDV
jgi:hypothetical protein